MKEFKFKKAENKMLEFQRNINTVLKDEKEKSVLELKTELNKKLDEFFKKEALEIAFVGQYGAGKSTIIKALTNNKNIKTGQDITTDKPDRYKWGSVVLVDTPGIYAGRKEHDKLSIEYMNRADLLVYVITTQGFIDHTAKNFRKLAFEDNRINRMMLVINKSSQGNKAESMPYWISDALKVTEPKTEKDLYLSVIDAQDYIEALEMDDEEDKKELIEYSGFLEFVDNLNAFIQDKGLIGRVLTPLNLINEYIIKIISELSSSNEDTKNFLELLNRKYFRVLKSKQKLEKNIKDEITILSENIKNLSGDLITLIEKGASGDILEEKNQINTEKIEEMTENTVRRIEEKIETEFERLQEELDIMMKSELAQELLNNENLKITFNQNIKVKQKKPINSKQLSNIVKDLGTFAKGFAINPEALKAGEKGLKLAVNGDAHKVIYKVGKFFGYKFKPWEAVKYADKIGKIGNILSKLGPIIALMGAAFEEYQEKKYEEEIQKAKIKIKNNYYEIADDIKHSILNQFNELVLVTYEKELEDVNFLRNSIQIAKKQNQDKIEELNEILKDNELLMKELG